MWDFKTVEPLDYQTCRTFEGGSGGAVGATVFGVEQVLQSKRSDSATAR